MGLLSLAKDADGIVCPTSTTRIGTVTLHRGQCIRTTDAVIFPVNSELLTLDFFNLQRSQALQTLLRTLSECEWSDVGVDCLAVILFS